MARRANFHYFRFVILGLLLCSAQVFAINDSPQTFTLDGQLFQTGTTIPLIDNAVKVTVQILNPAGTCLLYEEQQTVDTHLTSGYFHLNVGSPTGSAKRTVSDPGRLMSQIFQNIAGITANNVPGQTCAGGVYSPTPGAVRYFRITVTPSSTNVADVLTPDVVIDSVPNAVVAQSLQGLDRTGFLQVNNSGSTVLTQANLEAAFTTPAYANLQSIFAGNFIKTDTSGAALPSYSSNPASPTNGEIWFDTTTGEVKYKNSAGIQIVGASSGGGGISSLTVGSAMSVNGTVAGTISGPGTIDLSNTGVASGTYTKVTVDTKGRVTAGTVSLAEGDIPNLTTAGKVSGNTITSGTISGSAAINTTGNLITTGTVSGLNVQVTNLRIYNGTNYVQMTAGAISGNVNFTLPTGAGSVGQLLSTDGNGVMSWVNPPTVGNLGGDVSGALGSNTVQKIQGRSVTAGTVSGQVMIYNGTQWVNSVVSGDATLAYDGTMTLNKVPVSKGGTNATSFGVNRVIASNGTGSALTDITCSLNQVLSFDASGYVGCANLSSISPSILNGGNATGADISIGTNDNKALKFKVNNNTVAMTISQNGDVGIGTASPLSRFTVSDVGGSMSFSSGAMGPAILSLQNTSASAAWSLWQGYTTYNDLSIFQGGTLKAHFAGGGFVVGSSGNSPTNTLDVYGNAAIGTGYASIINGPTNGLIVEGNVGVGTASPSSALDVSGAITAEGMSSAPSVSASNTGRIYYDYSTNKFRISQNGAAYVDLVGAGSITSLGGQTGATQTFAISADNSVATPTISSASNTHTWKIPMASNAGTTAGLLSKTDYDAFNTKLGTTTSFAGDVSGAYNSTVVQKIQGKAVTAGSVSGQIMIYDGTQWVNSAISGDATLNYVGALTLNKVPVSKGGTNATSFGVNRVIASNGTGSALTDITCSLNQVLAFDASGYVACANLSSISSSILNGGNTTGADISIGTNDTKNLYFKTNNINRASIDANNGTFRIGLYGSSLGPATINSPNFLLNDDSGNYPRLTIRDGYFTGAVELEMVAMHASVGMIGTATNQPLAFKTNNIEGMRLSPSIGLGIGTSSPSSALDVSGAITAEGMSSAPSVSASHTGRIYYDYTANKFKVSQNGAAYVDLVGSGGSGSGNALLMGGNSTAADISVGSNDNYALLFRTNNATAMTISQGGSVGIGTSAPSEKLEVNGNVKAAQLVLSSDRNLKRDIQPLENSLEKILSLSGVRYHWRCEEYPERNFDQLEHMGLIAQEVARIYPNLVHGKEGNMSVDYVGLIAPMIEAIKEQQKQIHSLKDEVSQLKQANSKQEERFRSLMNRIENLEKRK